MYISDQFRQTLCLSIDSSTTATTSPTSSSSFSAVLTSEVTQQQQQQQTNSSSAANMQAYQSLGGQAAGAFGMQNSSFYTAQSQGAYGVLQQPYPMADGKIKHFLLVSINLMDGIRPNLVTVLKWN